MHKALIMYTLINWTRFLKLLGFLLQLFLKRSTIIIEVSFGFLIAFENTIRMSAHSLIASVHPLIVVKLYYIIRSVSFVGRNALLCIFFVGKRILSLLYKERIILTHFGDESKRNKISPTIIKRQENIWTIIENAVS